MNKRVEDSKSSTLLFYKYFKKEDESKMNNLSESELLALIMSNS